MELHARDHIIHLGKVLAEEDRRGCDDGAVTGGLAPFLDTWRAAANGALSYPAVQEALALLTDYEVATTKRSARSCGALAGGLASIVQEPDTRHETRDTRRKT